MGLTRTFPIDTALQLEPGLVAITGTEVNTNAAGAAYLDLGDGLCHGALVVYLTDISVGAGDGYELELQGGVDAAFSVATNTILAYKHMGIGAVTGATPGDTTTATTTGVYYMPFVNETNGTTYRYVRLKVTMTETGGETITYSAYLSTQRTMG